MGVQVGGQQLAFWNAHHDERGSAPMHIYHVASGTPVVAILRPARTAKGMEVRANVRSLVFPGFWPHERGVPHRASGMALKIGRRQIEPLLRPARQEGAKASSLSRNRRSLQR
jgi:hypothetical protein